MTRNEKRTHENDNMGILLLLPMYKDERGHNYWTAQCPYCGQPFVVREDSVKSGNTKSCGCLRRSNAQKIGRANKRENKFLLPLGYDYGICFYDNHDSYFIFDIDQYEKIKNYHWTAIKNKERIEAITVIEGKAILASRFIMDTPEGLECDHINHVVADNRKCNLRNCTKKENLYNREVGQGRIVERNGNFVINGFPNDEMAGVEHSTEEEASSALKYMQDKYFGEFSYRRSQEIADMIETNQFTDSKYYGCGLEEIEELPEKNLFKSILTSIKRNKKNNLISEENETSLLLQLIEDYNLSIDKN